MHRNERSEEGSTAATSLE